MRVRGFASGLMVALLASVPAWAADVPKTDFCAVSGMNGKLAASGGGWDADNYDSQGMFQGIGSLSMPLGCALGLQVDAGVGTFGEASATGLGGHVFMRDPTSYLFGVHATYEDWNFDAPALDVTSWKVGAEAELYLGNVSLEAWAGVEDTNRSSSDFFGKLTAAFYATDDLRLAAGVRHAGDVTSGVLSAEWQMPEMPLSLTAEAQAGEDDFRSIAVGAKFYFGGEQKSLIDRHRQDDPDDGLFDFLGGAAAAAACAPAGGPPQGLLEALAVDGAATSCATPPVILLNPEK